MTLDYVPSETDVLRAQIEDLMLKNAELGAEASHLLLQRNWIVMKLCDGDHRLAGQIVDQLDNGVAEQCRKEVDGFFEQLHQT